MTGIAARPAVRGSGAAIRHLILDRDGVLVREGDTPIRRTEDWVWEDTALGALRLAATAGLTVTVATNQSAVDSGLVAPSELDQLHRWAGSIIRSTGVRFRGFFCCVHAAERRCSCRKPQPGLLLSAMSATGIGPGNSIMVGDDLRDLEAARRAGIPSLLVRTGKGSSVEQHAPSDIRVVDELSAAVSLVLRGAAGMSDARDES